MSEIDNGQLFNYDRRYSAKQRSALGAYYTPLLNAQQMARDAVECLLQNYGLSPSTAEKFVTKKLARAQAVNLLDLLSRLDWLDPAAGTGIFGYAYLQAIDQWVSYYQPEQRLPILNKVMQAMTLNDIDGQAVAQFRRVVRQHWQMEFSGRLIASDALLERPFAAAKFDVIIINPPYMGERGNRRRFDALKRHRLTQSYYRARMDYAYYFIHLAIDLLRPNGVATLLTPRYFLTADSCQQLRSYFRDSCDFLRIRTAVEPFKDVKNLSFIIFTFSLKQAEARQLTLYQTERTMQLAQAKVYDAYGQIQLTSQRDFQLLAKIEMRAAQPLAEVLEVKQGLVSGADRVTPRHRKYLAADILMGSPIFVFDQPPVQDDLLKPFIKNSEVSRYYIKRWPQRKILYSYQNNLSDRSDWLRHLQAYRALLCLRREVSSGHRQWYELTWPRQPQLFERLKIIAPQRAQSNRFALVESPLYGSADIYFLHLRQGEQLSEPLGRALMKALTIYLNSPLVNYWLRMRGKRKGQLLELYATPLKRIPLPANFTSQLALLAAVYDDMAAAPNAAALATAHRAIYQLYDLNDLEIERVESDYL